MDPETVRMAFDDGRIKNAKTLFYHGGDRTEYSEILEGSRWTDFDSNFFFRNFDFFSSMNHTGWHVFVPAIIYSSLSDVERCELALNFVFYSLAEIFRSDGEAFFRFWSVKEIEVLREWIEWLADCEAYPSQFEEFVIARTFVHQLPDTPIAGSGLED